MYAQNCWYVVATSDEIPHGRPICTELAERSLVLYRRGSDGGVVALDNRCAHRMAPLSEGRIEGDDLRCMYHGVRFGPDGRCNQVPGQDAIPRGFVQQRFAVVERQNWVWLWLGQPEEADLSMLPDTPGLDSSAWHIRQGQMTYDADYRLMNDNLCDLSHVSFVHEASFAQLVGDELWAQSRPQQIDLPRGVRLDRWMTNSPVPPDLALPVTHGDVFVTYDYLLGGIFRLNSMIFSAGTAERSGFGEPGDRDAALTHSCSTQAVTPVSPTRLQYRYAAAVRASEPALRADIFYAVMEQAFVEDKKMIESQHRMVSRYPDRQLSATRHDKAAVRFRRLIEQHTAR